MNIKGKKWWLEIKSKHTGHPMILEPTQTTLNNILHFDISYGNIMYEDYNWFRYLNGDHPLEWRKEEWMEGWEIYIKDTFDKYYDINIVLKGE